MTERFVGREVELGRLVSLTRTVASSGGCALALIRGAAGSGKSRLLEEVAARAPLRHRFRVRGYEVERAVPLAAAADLLRDLTGGAGEGSQLREVLFDPGGAEGDALRPLRVFEAAHRALRTRQPALLLIDDLQWIDDRSRALCHYLLRAAVAGRQRLVVVAAARLEAGAAFVASLAELVPAERVIRLDLGPLDRDAGIALARSVVDVDDDRATELWLRSGGNPFWLRALTLTEESALQPEDVLQAELAGLSSAALPVMDALAVAGRALGTRDLSAALEAPRDEVEAGAEELLRRGLIVRHGDQLDVGHDLLREAAVRRLSPVVERDLHRRLAVLVEATGGGDLRELLRGLRHRRAAGIPAVELALTLARSPHRHLLGREGLAALAEVADAAEPDAEQTLELQREVATLALVLGDHRSALVRYTTLAARLGDRTERAWAYASAAKAAYALGLAEEALDLTARARVLAPDDAPLAIVLDARTSAVRRWLQGRRDQGLELAERAVMAARLLADAEGVSQLDQRARRAYISSLTAVFDAATFEDDANRMLAVADEIVEVARGFDERALLRGLFLGGLALRFLGRLAESEIRLRAAVEETERRVEPRAGTQAAYWLARVLRERGELRAASEALRSAAELSRRLGPSPTHPRVERERAVLELSTGDWQRAMADLEAIAAAEPDPHFRLDAHEALATWGARLRPDGDRDAVADRLEAALADAIEAGCRRCQGEVRLRGASTLARLGDGAGARELLEEWGADARVAGGPARFWRQRAEALLAAGSHDPAGDLLLEAAETADAMGLRFEALWARLDAGRLVAGRDHDSAAALLRAVRGTAERMGAVTESRLAEEALRDLGVRTRTRGSSPAPSGAPWERLTEREHEVAQQVVAGRSNPEIAAALFLSRRTVERHVSNILDKLGAHNRTQLAAMLATGTEVGGPHP